MREERVKAGGNGLVQVRAERRNGFTRARRKRFLAVLAATCNVRIAVDAVGIAATTAYYWRRDDPEFAAQWRVAVTTAYERLETALLARAMGTDGAAAGCDFGDPDAILPEAQIDAELALKLLNRHRATAEGRDRPMRPGRHIATEEETNKALLKQLAVLRRQIEKSGGALLMAPEAPGLAAPEVPETIEHKP